MNKKKNTVVSNISERDKKLLFGLGAILILACAFFFVFSPNQKKSDELSTENTELKNYITQLDTMIANEEQKKAEIVSFNEMREAILAKFPGGMTHEKAIATIADLQDVTGFFSSQDSFSVNNINFDEAEARSNGTVPIVTEDYQIDSPYAVTNVTGEEFPQITEYKTTVTMSFTCTNEELTDVLDYINQNEEKMSVETITVGYDAETGNLTGTMNLCMYCISGVEDKVYEEPEITNISLVVSNIFISKEIKKSKKN